MSVKCSAKRGKMAKIEHNVPPFVYVVVLMDFDFFFWDKVKCR